MIDTTNYAVIIIGVFTMNQIIFDPLYRLNYLRLKYIRNNDFGNEASLDKFILDAVILGQIILEKNNGTNFLQNNETDQTFRVE